MAREDDYAFRSAAGDGDGGAERLGSSIAVSAEDLFSDPFRIAERSRAGERLTNAWPSTVLSPHCCAAAGGDFMNSTSRAGSMARPLMMFASLLAGRGLYLTWPLSGAEPPATFAVAASSRR